MTTMANQTPKQRAALATEKLKGLDSWYAGQSKAIMSSQSLTPAAKRQEIAALRKDYRERWTAQKQEAVQWLEEEEEGYFARANPAEKSASKDEAILRELTRQRVRGRAAQLKDSPGKLLAMYEVVTKNGDAVAAEELEAVIPPLLPESERAAFEQRAEANAYERLPESVKQARADHKEFQQERSGVETALSMMETSRSGGYVPGVPTETALVTSYPAGRPPQVDEVPNPNYRSPHERAAEEVFERTLGPGATVV